MHKMAIATAMLVIATAATGGTMDAATGLVKGFEGFRPSVYKCEAGRATIGYGFTDGRLVAKGRLTEAEASAELDRKCKEIAVMLRKEIGTANPLTPSQEAAVVSLIYNVGWGAFKTSTMCRLLKEGKRGAAVGLEFRKWVYVRKGGRRVVSRGLMRRRATEAKCFLMG